MSRSVSACGWLVILVFLQTSVGFGQTQPSTGATVRVYDTFGLADADLKAAQFETVAIFRDAGVRLRWRTCAGPTQSDEPLDPCRDILQPGELLMRIAKAPAGIRPEVLGYSFVDAETQSGVLATVLADRVSRTALRIRVRFDVLLGRTVAHELGHLLIGTNDHTPAGLMQSNWSNEDLRGSPAAMRFSTPDAARMTWGLSERSTAVTFANLPAPDVLTAK